MVRFVAECVGCAAANLAIGLTLAWLFHKPGPHGMDFVWAIGSTPLQVVAIRWYYGMLRKMPPRGRGKTMEATYRPMTPPMIQAPRWSI